MTNPNAIKMINRYFTPLALFLILSSAFVSTRDKKTIMISVVLVFLSVTLNLSTAYFIGRKSTFVKTINYIRLALNFLVNIVIVYLLIGTWGPLWLLFVLTPVASAVYYDTKMCFIISLISSLTLLLIYFFRGLEGLVSWAQAITHAVFIIFISMFVNSLCKICFLSKDK